jgi:biotin-(acetyl-CoA carboxylase) ligase
MNLMQPPPDVSHSVSLAALTGSVLSPPEVVVSLLPALSDAIQQFDSAGFQPFRSEWLQMAAYRGERMVVDLGGELVRGVFTSISSEGCLQIDTGAGVRDITAGHIVSIGADDGSGTYRNRAATDCE